MWPDIAKWLQSFGPNIVQWWQSLWTDATVIGGAVAGFVSALVMFIVGDVIWKGTMERTKREIEFRQKQLELFYAPLYAFYRQAFAKFDIWRNENPDTQLVRQPFFEATDDEAFAEEVFMTHPGYASQELLRLWSDFKACEDMNQRGKRRQAMIKLLVQQYHQLRRKLDLDFDKRELKTGEFLTST